MDRLHATPSAHGVVEHHSCNRPRTLPLLLEDLIIACHTVNHGGQTQSKLIKLRTEGDGDEERKRKMKREEEEEEGW